MLKFKWETEFKETEIGEIPRDWEIKEVKDLVDKTLKFPIVDGPFGTQLHMDEYTSEGVPVIRVINLSFEGEFIEDDLVFISEEKFNTLKRSSVKPNDLIIAKTGATIGKLALLPEHINQGLIASSCLKVTFDFKKAIPKFYLYFFMTQVGQESIKNRAEGGSTRDTINLTPFSEIPVPLPPLPEQTRVANVLSYFDNLIKNKRRQNEILEKTAMAIFKSWFIDFEPFRACPEQERGNYEFVYNEELGKEIPKGWEVKRLGEVVKTFKGISYKSAEKYQEYIEGGYIFITLDNFVRGGGFKTEYSWIKSERIKPSHLVREGDLIIALTDMTQNTQVVGAPAIVILPNGFDGGVISLDCMKIESIVENLKYYLYMFLKDTQEDNSTFANGVNVLHLMVNNFLTGKIIFIPPPHILQSFHSLIEPLFQKIILNQKQIMTLRKIRDTLLPLLVFGKLRVEEI